jgi:hypothetical protein
MTNEITKTRANVRILLWVVLAISLAGNVATSASSGGAILANIGLGLVALASGVALAVHHYRHR